MRRSEPSQWAVLPRSARSGSALAPAHASVSSTMSLTTLPNKMFAFILALVLSTSHCSLGRVFPVHHQITLAMADTSGPIKQERPFHKTSCLPLKLHDTVLTLLLLHSSTAGQPSRCPGSPHSRLMAALALPSGISLILTLSGGSRAFPSA